MPGWHVLHRHVTLAGQVLAQLPEAPKPNGSKPIAGAAVSIIAAPPVFITRLVAVAGLATNNDPKDMVAQELQMMLAHAKAAEQLQAVQLFLDYDRLGKRAGIGGLGGKATGQLMDLFRGPAKPMDEKLGQARTIVDGVLLKRPAAAAVERPDYTVTRADGTFYFLDLDKGEYTVIAKFLRADGSVQTAAPKTITLAEDQVAWVVLAPLQV